MYNIGVLGFAHGHVMSYAPQWALHPEWGVQVVAGWDHDAARAEDKCQMLQATAYPTVEALLDSGVDGVIISSETVYHAELVERAAAAGKDILCYKPLALTMAEADRIVHAVEQHGVRFSMGWQMRTDPQNEKIKELIDSGELGRVFQFRRRHCLGTHLWGDFASTWHNQKELNRDIFADDSAHAINWMQHLFGMPQEVIARITTAHNPAVPNDNGVAVFSYPNGMLAEISCNFACSAAEITTEVYLEKGAIAQYFGDGPATRLPRVPGMPGLKWFKEGDADWTDSGIPSPKAHGERIVAQAQPIADFFTGRRGTLCSAQEGRDTLRLVLACYLSEREGARVSVYDDRVYEF
jgi:predicted dehydrogenase